ncbi:hypothetical protein XELAEV_18023239mg [Xenopus laevis]|uniref:Uncharacterized protein n=1 Tax=Xenopus laevis TaxID=8355 RepID=A0A974D6G6_XENLA|nr:hypothetical protein XELAEV_18023239mg [Xenopus laevis]
MCFKRTGRPLGFSSDISACPSPGVLFKGRSVYRSTHRGVGSTCNCAGRRESIQKRQDGMIAALLLSLGLSISIHFLQHPLTLLRKTINRITLCENKSGDEQECINMVAIENFLCCSTTNDHVTFFLINEWGLH